MGFDPVKAKKLYDSLISDGYTTENLGSEAEFTKAISDSSSAVKIYSHLKTDGYTNDNLGTQDEFVTTFVKKKESSEVSFGDVINTAKNGINASQSTSVPSASLPPEVEIDYNSQNPIDLAKDAEVKSKQQTYVSTSGGTGGAAPNFTADTKAIEEANKINENLESRGYNKDALNKTFSDFNPDWFNIEGFDKNTLAQEIKDNPHKAQRKIASAKWELPLVQGLFDAGKDVSRLNKLLADAQNNDTDYATKRSTNRELYNIIATSELPDKEKILENFSIDHAYAYGTVNKSNAALQKEKEQYKDNPLINENHILAIDYLKDVAPDKAAGFEAALIDPKLLKDNFAAQMGQEEKLKRLEEIGISLRENSIKERLKTFENTANKMMGGRIVEESFTPDELVMLDDIGRYSTPLQEQLAEINNNKGELLTKYPKAGVHDAELFAQEILGQKHTGLNWFALESGKATENAAQSIYDLVSTPFASDENLKMRQNEILGTEMASESSTHLTQKNQTTKTFTPTVKEGSELETYIESIKADDKLSFSQKKDAITVALMRSPDEWQRTPIEGGKSNIGLTSLLYGTGSLAATLAPFVLAETATGGGATASYAKKFTSTFVSMMATSYHDALSQAIDKGEAEPYAYAMRVTAINSAAMAGAGTPAAIRKLLSGTKSAAGDLVMKMTDKEIEVALQSESKAMKAFRTATNAGKVIAGATKEGFVTAAKIQPFMTAGQVLNDAADGNVQDPMDYLKQASIEALKFGIMGAALGTVGRIGKEPNELSKAAMYEAGNDPKGFLEALAQKEENNSITKDEADQVRNNITKAEEVFKKVPFVDSKGRPMSERQKRDLLFLKMQENELNETLKKDLPENLIVRTEKIIEEIKQKIDKVYKGKYDDAEKVEPVKVDPAEEVVPEEKGSTNPIAAEPDKVILYTFAENTANEINTSLLDLQKLQSPDRTEELSKLPQRLYEGMEKNTSIKFTPEIKGRLQKLFGALLSERQNKEGELQAMSESELADASRRLYEAIGNNMAVPDVPHGVTQVKGSGDVTDKVDKPGKIDGNPLPGRKIYLKHPPTSMGVFEDGYRPKPDERPNFPKGEYEIVHDQPNGITIKNKDGDIIKLSRDRFELSENKVQKISTTGKEIEPHDEVSTDLKVIAKELGYDGMDVLYPALKNIPLEDRADKADEIVREAIDNVDDYTAAVERVETFLERQADKVRQLKAKGMSEKTRDQKIAKENKQTESIKEDLVDAKKNLKEAQKIKDSFKNFIDGDSPSIDLDRIGEAIDKIDARYQTRRHVKTGVDLFPEDANIPEFIAIKKELTKNIDDDTIKTFEQRPADEVEKSEPVVQGIEGKAESTEESELTEAVAEADKFIAEATQPAADKPTSEGSGSKTDKASGEEQPEVSDRELEQAVGHDVFKSIERSESMLGEGIVNRARMLETAKRIAQVDGKKGLPPEAVFEALQYETGYPDNWQDLRSAIKKGGIDNNSDAVQREIQVGIDLPKDIIEEYKKSKRYKDEQKTQDSAGESAFKTKTKIATTLEEAKTKPVSVHDISKFINDVFGVPIRKGLVRWGQRIGIYKVTPEVIRVKNTSDIGTLTHELAHHVDKKFFFRKFPHSAELKLLDYDQKKQRAFEGFAEFVRKWTTGDGDLTKEAPKFLDFWENDFLKNNKDVGEKLLTIKKYVDIWREQGSMARILGSINKTVNPEQTTVFGKKGKKLVTDLVDANYPLKQLVDKVLSLQGRTRKEYESDPTWKGKDPFLLAGVVAKTAGAKAKAWVLDGPRDFAGNQIGKSLKEIIAPVKTEIDQAMAFVISLRRIGRARKGVEYTANDIEDASYVIKQFKDNDAYKTFAKEITEWNRLPIEYLVESGAMSRELANKIINSDVFYVPLRALTEHSDIQKAAKVKGIANTGKTVGRFRDTGGQIVDPLESIAQNVERIISVADKSRVVHALLNITEGVDGVGKIIEEVPAPMQAMKATIETIKKQLEDSGADLSEADMDDFITIYSSGGKTNNLPENVIALYKNGKLKYYQVDPTLYKTIAGLDGHMVKFLSDNIFGKAMVFSTRLLRLGSTGARAGFQLISNPFRDFFTAIMQTRGNAMNVPIDNMKAFKDVVKGGEMLERYKASGVEMATPLGADRRNIQGLVNKAIADPAQRKLMNIALHPIEALGKVYDAYVHFISIPESIPRVAEYKKIFKKYEPLIEKAKEDGDLVLVKELENARQVDATDAANEVTLNFKKAGIYASVINQVAFGFNPAIRGLAKMSTLLRDAPVKTMTRGIISITAPSLLLYLMNKDEEWYKNLPDWEKHGFYHFKIGDTVIRLPKPFEWGWAFSTLPETLAQTYDDKDPKHILEGLYAGTTVLPSFPIPDAIKTPLQAYFDWDLYRMKTITPQSEADLLPEMQYGKYTSPIAKKLGDILGVSPRKIDYLLSGYTGGLATEIINALPKEYKEKTDIPVIGRLFVRKSAFTESGQYTQDFYDIASRGTTLVKSINKVESGVKDSRIINKDGTLNLNKRDQYIYDNKEDIDDIVGQLSELRKQSFAVDKEALPAELKEKTLDALAYAQYQLVKEFLDQMKKDMK